jgi:hypothetical protein
MRVEAGPAPKDREMAFCPNCGTPNTDQAEKCVSCAYDLAPKSKGKFKGTIMMSGVQAPLAKPPAAAPQAAPQPAAEPPAAAPNRNLAFEKTMLGGPAVVPPAPAAAPAPTPAADLARAATVESPAPQFSAPAAPSQPASFTRPASPEPADQPSAGFGNVSDDFPSPPKPNTGKVLAIGCAVVAVMTLVITGLLYVVAKDRLKGLFGSAGGDPAAQQWRVTLAEALSQVSALCQTNCANAANFFHPSLDGALLTEAKSLSAGALKKLSVIDL